MLSAIDLRLDRWFHRRPVIAKWIRYSSASAAGTVTTQLAIAITFGLLGMEAVPANIVSVTAGAIPNYFINRAWTFNKRDPHSFTREVLPFWGMALLGLILSTVLVAWANDRFDGAYWAVAGSNIAAFGLLWVGKFFVLERILFKVVDLESEPEPDRAQP